MHFTIEKFQRRVAELGQRRYLSASTIAPFASMEGTLPADLWYTDAPESVQGGEFNLNDYFTGRDKYLWLEKDVTVPEHREGFEAVGLFDFGDTFAGCVAGFESMLYLNKKPFQGVDSNHKEVLLGEYEGQSVNLTFLLWTGLVCNAPKRGFFHQCRQAEMAYLHKKTDELYYFGRAILETLYYLDKNSEQYQDLVGILERVLRCINWDGDLFFASIEKAHAQLMEDLGNMEKKTELTAYVVGHTHIDVAWLWRLKHTREKAQRSFSTVLRLMERYDEYVFLQSQPQLYKYIKQDNPELYAKIKKRIEEGRWEIEGGMWVEADCNISSGEALVRQFLYGTRFIEAEFGKKCNYLWLPDVFGYSWALPQIIKQCEMDTFATAKISGNQYNTIPDDLFMWRGIDGTEILTYFINTPGAGGQAAIESKFATYNGMMEPQTVLGTWQRFKNKELSKDYMIPYGYGDGGGGVNRDMLEMRRAMNVLPGCPNVKSSTAGAFFEKLHQSVKETDRYIHTWDGELYFEWHRGTYTTQAYNKKMNRLLENNLGQIEWLSSLAYILGGEYAEKQINDSWECVLLHQFHDIIPGSSIHEVYTDSRINYTKAYQQAEEARKVALDYLMESVENRYTIYSSNSFGGRELVHIPETRYGQFLDDAGNILLAQKMQDGYLVNVDVKPFGTVELEFQKLDIESQEESVFIVDDEGLQTPFYKISWNEDGQITQIFDKEANRQVLRDGELGNVFEIYEDKPLDNDAWDVDLFYTQKMEQISQVGKPIVKENGSLRLVIQFSYRYHNSRIEQDVILYRDSKRIDFRTWVDWHEDHRLLKTAFYTDIRSTKATYDIQFGHIERPTYWNNSWDWARFEVCGHKWADLSETSYGVSLLNDCKYGYSIKDNAMKLTLLKSSKVPDEQADMGEHIFSYSLYPHIGSVTVGGTIEEANRINLPAQVVFGKLKDTRRLVRVNHGGVQLDAIKKAEDEDCIIVRLHECRGDRCQVVLTSDYPVKRIVPCNLLEHDVSEGVSCQQIDFAIKPFEIRTFKLYL